MNSNPDPRTQPLTGTTNAKRMSKTRKVVLIISGIVIALVLVGVLGIAIIISAFRGNPPSIRDNSVLVLKVAGPLPDYVPDDPFRRLFGGQPLSLNSLLAQLRKAKVDKRITAVMRLSTFAFLNCASRLLSDWGWPPKSRRNGSSGT